MKPRLLAIDIDGTLLSSKGELTDRTIQALKNAKKAGIFCILATGRMSCSGLVFAKQLGFSAPCVFYNGAVIMNPKTQEIYFKQEIEASLVARVCDFFRENGWYLQKYVADRLCVVDASDERTQYYVSIAKVEPISMGERFWTEHKSSTKLLGCAKAGLEDFSEMLEKTQAKFGKELYVASSWKRFVELVNPGVNKAQAVAKVSEMLRLTRENVISFGDSTNDAEMLRWAGCGVAMGNASDTTKACADIVIDTNDNEGLAKYVEQLLKE